MAARVRTRFLIALCLTSLVVIVWATAELSAELSAWPVATLTPSPRSADPVTSLRRRRSVGEDEAAKQRAADASRAADAQFLNYYADNYVEDLAGKWLRSAGRSGARGYLGPTEQ